MIKPPYVGTWVLKTLRSTKQLQFCCSGNQNHRMKAEILLLGQGKDILTIRSDHNDVTRIDVLVLTTIIRESWSSLWDYLIYLIAKSPKVSINFCKDLSILICHACNLLLPLFFFCPVLCLLSVPPYEPPLVLYFLAPILLYFLGLDLPGWPITHGSSSTPPLVQWPYFLIYPPLQEIQPSFICSCPVLSSFRIADFFGCSHVSTKLRFAKC